VSTSGSSESHRPPFRLSFARLSVLGVLAVVVLAVGALLLSMAEVESARTACLSGERSLSTGLLLYTQDHDGRLPPPDYQADGRWRSWLDISAPYLTSERIAVCPANRADGAVKAHHGYKYPYTYALNERFFGVFSPGPFPLENLEIAPQTAMLVEGGAFRGSRAPGWPRMRGVCWATSSPALPPAEGNRSGSVSDG